MSYPVFTDNLYHVDVTGVTTDYLTGGARIGGFNATWPFAKLRANKGQITLNVMFSGEYIFPENHIIEIKKYCSIPFFGWGICIEHTIPDYPEEIIFWYLGYPKTVLSFITASGFNSDKLCS